ncbi:MAG: hypothetical protein FJW34_22405, partial [Acidobacteria bacterium]|nr:hypothetical protein [Acidobacteriota bacterium]
MTTPADALRRLVEVLDRLSIPYMVGGSVASSIHGIARPTLDVDLVAALAPGQVDCFAAELGGDFYADAALIRAALEQGRPFNLIHYATAFKFDVFPALPDPYHQLQLERRLMAEATQLGDVPIRCAVATAEDTVLAKLEWYRVGGETSERQWNDLRGIVRVRGPALDLEYLRR